LDPLFTLNQLRLQQFDPDTERAEFVPLEKLRVAIGRNVGGGFCGGVDGIWIRLRIHEAIIEGLKRPGNSGWDAAF
jgi:hypothetical protein